MANENKETNALSQDNDTLKKTRTILLSGEINKDLAENIIKQLLFLEAEDENAPIWIYINSPGGEVDSGLAIYDMVRYIKPKVNMLGIGLIASAASLIYLAVPKEQRFSLPHASYLIHQPLSEMRGRASEIEIYADKLNKIKYVLNLIIAEATGKKVEDVEKNTDKDYWLSAAEAKEYGIVGKIVDKR